MRKIIIDCDPGHDDAVAILLGCAFAASFLIPKPETIPDTLAAEDVAARA